MRYRTLFALSFLSCLAFVPAMPAPLRVAFGLLQAFLVPGFVFFLWVWDRRAPALDRLFVPPLLSPVVLSLLVAGAFALTGSLGASVVLAMIVLYGFLLVAFVRERRSLASDAAEPLPLGALVVPLLFAALIGAYYIVNRYLLLRSDTFVHAPIVGEILDHGIPPLEPRLPHSPIRYPWFFHLFAACVVRLTGLGVFPSLGLLNVVSGLAFPYVVARIAAHYSRRSLHIVSAQVMAVVGLSSAAWVLWPIALVKTLTGEVRGLSEVARILSQVDLNSYRVVYFLTPSGTLMVNPLDRFLTVSPFNHAIDLFLVCFALAVDRNAQRRAPFRFAICIVAAVVGTFLLHVVTGVTLILTILGAGIILAALRWLVKRERPNTFQSLIIPALAVLAGLLCFRYFTSLTGGEGKAMVMRDYLYFGIANLLTMIAPLAGLFFIVRPLSRYIGDVESPERGTLVAWLIALAFINVFANLPGQAELKFALLFLTVLGIPATIVLIDWLAATGRTIRALSLLWLAVLFAVPTVLTGRGFFLDAPATEATRHAIAPSPDRTRLFEWLRTETPVSSAILEMGDETYTPLHAHRHTFAQWEALNSLLGYETGTAARHSTIRREVFSEGYLSAESLDYMRSLDYDIYLVVWTDERVANPRLDGELDSLFSAFERVYENPSGEVYHLRRSSAPSR